MGQGRKHICEDCERITYNRRVCSTCSSRRTRAADPIRAAYLALKNNSKRRGIFNDLTEEDFREFAIENKLLIRRGHSKDAYTVDRIIEELGYTRGNLQRLTRSKNSKKEQARRRALSYDFYSGGLRYLPALTGVPAASSADCPF